MDRMSGCGEVMEVVQVTGFRIASLLFADDVFLLASSSCDLQSALGRLAAKREVGGL